MTSILGIAGSARPWGNSELLIRQILRGAEVEGASVHLLRLTDLHLESCTGCMRCVIGGRDCPLEDDMAWLVKTIEAADGLALAAPTYFLGPAAVIKLVLDRLLMVTGQVERELRPMRPAVTLVTAGLEGWRGVTLPFLNAMVTALGFLPIESRTAFAPGPGEVLLDDGLMEQVWEAGRRLGRLEMEALPALAGACPVCHCDAFVLHGDGATCPVCGREAAVETGGEDGRVRLRFDPVASTHERWTPEGMRAHMIDWVMATGPRYMARRSEIKARRGPYREMQTEWLCPQDEGRGRGD